MAQGRDVTDVDRLMAWLIDHVDGDEQIPPDLISCEVNAAFVSGSGSSTDHPRVPLILEYALVFAVDRGWDIKTTRAEWFKPEDSQLLTFAAFDDGECAEEFMSQLMASKADGEPFEQFCSPCFTDGAWMMLVSNGTALFVAPEQVRHLFKINWPELYQQHKDRSGEGELGWTDEQIVQVQAVFSGNRSWLRSLDLVSEEGTGVRFHVGSDTLTPDEDTFSFRVGFDSEKITQAEADAHAIIMEVQIEEITGSRIGVQVYPVIVERGFGRED